jgi:hypothetical protein
MTLSIRTARSHRTACCKRSGMSSLPSCYLEKAYLIVMSSPADMPIDCWWPPAKL